jgi:hypothetical protein
MNDLPATSQQATEQHPHVAIITATALKHGRAIYYGATYAEADRALRVWFAVFATEQSILIGLPPVASRRADAAPNPATARIKTMERWAQQFIAEGTTFEILPVQTSNPLEDLLHDLKDEAHPKYEAAVKAAVARVALDLVR